MTSASPFGKYELLLELGRGGMGVVWKARQTDLERFVALKFLQATEDEDIRRFEREAQTAAGLTHPNIAQIYEVGIIDGRRYIAMQYVEGRILGPGLAPKQIAEAIRDAARAIDYANSRGVIHRDIKPANIMRDDAGRITVMDFGLARPVAADSSLTASGAIVGTPAYMSPEQAQGARNLDARTDVYALGATLYTLLTGACPFAGDTPMAVVMAVLNQEPLPPRRLNPKVHADLETICLKAMEKDPTRRYGSARDVADELDRFLQGEPILAKPATFLTLVARRVREHRAVSIAVSVAVLIGVAAGGILIGAAVTKRASIERMMREGDAAFERGDWAIAKEKFDGVHALDPAVPTRAAECQTRLDAALEAKKREDRRRAASNAFEAGRKAFDDATLLLYKKGATRADRDDALRGARQRFDEALAIFEDYAEALIYRARCALEIGDGGPALEDFNRAIAIAPDLGTAWYYRGLGYVDAIRELSSEVRRRGGFQDPQHKVMCSYALRDLRMAASKLREPEKEELALAWIEVVERRFAEALKRLDELVARNPRIEEAHMLRGVCLDEMERREGAIQAYSKAIDLRANYIEVLHSRAAQYYELERPDPAAADFEAILRYDGTDWRALGALGVTRVRQGRAAEGMKLVEQSIAAAPNKLRARVFRARALSEQGDRAAALAELDALAGKDPDLDVLYTRGGVLFELGRIEEAERDFDRVIAELPDDYDAAYHRGLCRYHLKRFEECVRDMTTALLRFTDDAGILCTRGLALWELRRFDEARRDFDEVVSKHPKDPMARTNRMEFRFDRDDWSGCLEDALALLDLDSKSVLARRRRAQCRVELGTLDGDTRSELDAVIEAEPEAGDAWYHRARLRERTGDPDGALSDYEVTVKLAPKWVEAWVSLGKLRLKRGRFQAALEALDVAITLSPKHPGAIANRGFTYFNLGRWKEAVGDLEKAIELAPSLAEQVGAKLEEARRKAQE